VFYKAVPAQYVSNPVGLPSSYCVKNIPSLLHSTVIQNNTLPETFLGEMKNGKCTPCHLPQLVYVYNSQISSEKTTVKCKKSDSPTAVKIHIFVFVIGSLVSVRTSIPERHTTFIFREEPLP
jgi:hypothetical protein